jgi:hypothetical protein
MTMAEQDKIMELHKKLIRSRKFTFPEKGKVKISDKHGVYIIYSPMGEVLHVGNTPSGRGGLDQRLYNHVTRSSSFSRLYLKPKHIFLRNKYQFQIIEVNSARKRALLEALTAGLLCPKHIGTGEKKKR